MDEKFSLRKFRRLLRKAERRNKKDLGLSPLTGRGAGPTPQDLGASPEPQGRGDFASPHPRLLFSRKKSSQKCAREGLVNQASPSLDSPHNPQIQPQGGKSLRVAGSLAARMNDPAMLQHAAAYRDGGDSVYPLANGGNGSGVAGGEWRGGMPLDGADGGDTEYDADAWSKLDTQAAEMGEPQRDGESVTEVLRRRRREREAGVVSLAAAMGKLEREAGSDTLAAERREREREAGVGGEFGAELSSGATRDFAVIDANYDEFYAKTRKVDEFEIREIADLRSEVDRLQRVIERDSRRW